MSLSYKDATRNTRLDDLTTALGTAAFLEIFTGSQPGKTAGTFNADTGTEARLLAVLEPDRAGQLGRAADVLGDHQRRPAWPAGRRATSGSRPPLAAAPRP